MHTRTYWSTCIYPWSFIHELLSFLFLSRLPLHMTGQGINGLGKPAVRCGQLISATPMSRGGGGGLGGIHDSYPASPSPSGNNTRERRQRRRPICASAAPVWLLMVPQGQQSRCHPGRTVMCGGLGIVNEQGASRHRRPRSLRSRGRGGNAIGSSPAAM